MKVTRLSCMLFIMGAMVMASSCKKQETTETIDVTAAKWQTEDATRIYIDFTAQHVFWDDGDQVNVYNVDFNNGLNSVCKMVNLNFHQQEVFKTFVEITITSARIVQRQSKMEMRLD